MVLLLLACSPSAGSLRINTYLSQALSVADVAAVTVSLTRAGLSLSQGLSKVNGSWQGVLLGIPVGTYTLQVNAYDGATPPNLLFTQTTPDVQILANQTTMAALVLQQAAPPSFTDAVPAVTALVASSNAPVPGGSINLTVSAIDADATDSLSFAFSSAAGSFSPAAVNNVATVNQGAAASTVWTAPAQSGTYTLSVTVTDSQGASTHIGLSVVVSVANSTGWLQVNALFNTWPTIGAMTSSQTPVNLTTPVTTLSVTAHDTDGDALSYSWKTPVAGTSDCLGSYGNPSSASTSFTLSSLPAMGNTCTVAVTVSDGQGGQTTGTLTLETGAAATVNLPPVIDLASQSPSAVGNGGVVSLSVTAHDSDGVSVSWSVSPAGTGSLGTASVSTMGNRTTSQISWTAPNAFAVASSVTITATASDGIEPVAAHITTHTFTIYRSLSGVITLAGRAQPSGGYQDGAGTIAQFQYPTGVAVDAAGNIYVADSINSRIRKIAPGGMVTTLAGSTYGYADGTGTAARFSSPYGVAVDAAGNVYVADTDNATIRKITPAGVVTTLAGSTDGYTDGTGSAAKFSAPYGVAVDAAGNVYVADQGNHVIRRITPARVVSTLAGVVQVADYGDGPATTAKFSYPRGVAVDTGGHIYVADVGNSRIRKLSPDGAGGYNVTTVAGSTDGYADGTGAGAQFSGPNSVCVDTAGNVYVADQYNNVIRRVTSAGVVTTLAGSGVQNWLDGTGPAAQFNGPSGVAVDAAGNVYVADQSNDVIRAITPGGVVTTRAGISSTNHADGTGTAAGFTNPYGVAVDKAGNVYVADLGNNLIRQITSDGVVTTMAGSGRSAFADGAGAAAHFYGPTGVAVDKAGGVYVADPANERVRRIALGDVVTTLAGSGDWGYVDGIGASAQFGFPQSVAVDAAGNVYVADSDNNVIRKVTAGGGVTTLAGSGQSGSADNTGTAAQFNAAAGVAVDKAGNVYVADTGNNMIRMISAGGAVSTLAGSPESGYWDDTGAAARFDHPTGVAVDREGSIYVADYNNHVIRKVTAAGVVTTLAGSGGSGYADGSLTTAMFNYPSGVAVDAAGHIYVADSVNNVIRKIQ